MAKFVDLVNYNNLLVVDALNLAFRWKHKGELTFAEDYVRTIQSLGSSYKASKIIVVCDHKGSTFRKNILPEYKQNRKEKFDKESEQEKEKSRLFFEEFDRTLDLVKDNFLTLRYLGVEADDLAAFIVNNYVEEFDHTWLISSDRDWDLLVTDNSSRFSYVTRKEISKENWGQHYEFPIEEYISVKCLTGDTNDNVPGVPGVGPKRAYDLVKTYGNALDIYDAIPLAGKYKYIQAVNDNKELILKNYMLMDLISFHEDAIGQDNIEDIHSKISSYIL